MKKHRQIVRVIALILVIMLVGGVVVGALISALAEPAVPQRNQCELTMEYMEEEQALHITQRLIYINPSGDRLDRVVFYAAPNMLRRQSALMYEDGDLAAVFPEGFTPGGIDLKALTVNGAAADYGFQGEDELCLRAACDIAPGGQAEFCFDYYLLLPRCGAFVGAGDEDIRLTAFCFVPGVYDADSHDFILKKPLPFTRWLHSDAADYTATVKLPEGYALAATGGAREGRVVAENVREFALCFGKRWRVIERVTASGVRVRVFSGLRTAGRAADLAARTIEQCEAWFGTFPVRELDIAQSDYPLGALNFPGLILLPEAYMGRAGEMALRFCAAQQYFGLAAYVEPVADAWLSDSVSSYVACLLLEADRGRDVFLSAINRDWVSALQLTIPGGLNVTSDAALFNGMTYDIVIKKRGAVALHELREAMGLEHMLDGLRRFYELGRDGRTLTEMDLVHCMDEASGGDWEAFLTDWVFNVGDYVNQTIDWLE